MIKPKHVKLSIRKQCELMGISRSGLYYEPAQTSEENLKLMRLIDEQYIKTPYYGSPKMTVVLNKCGYGVNIKRVKRLMKVIGISAIYPKPNTSLKRSGHKLYPYLLNGLKISRPNQVWCTDITYIRMVGGFMYLVVVMDWYSRYVISWELSNSLDSYFCTDALHTALAYARPEIFNTDQGVQFTSESFTRILSANNIQISMDGKGRFLDNIMIERLWRSLKYEDIFIKNYQTVDELHEGLTRYFYTYNQERPHQALNYETPYHIYSQLVSQREVSLC